MSAYVLCFEARAHDVNGRRVRHARFERRSALAVSAACVLATHIRESLEALLAAHVTLRLLEPVIPDSRAWHAISAGGHVFGVRGALCNAAFVLRPNDALALCAAAFGEAPGHSRTLSAVEQEVLVRALRGIAAPLTAVCGRELTPLEPVSDVRDYTTYFELLLERPVAARIGIALSRDPASAQGLTLRLDDLLGVELEVAVQFAEGALTAAEFLGLGPGSNVPMKTRVGEPGRLKVGGAVLARGECGSIGERNALIVTAVR